ncbi:DUF983 domain-containing protein [Paremcibacter congregatus]|uniref:DUF983 domain-containing protein n=1 Tax=Paremcibacter congregatus TaxID=2043170 RepID=A0A2G4YTP4_9PROT|nr:DUF983 domain-containing protein [Paremcibacter congregatus]PHZ85620.1 hypothetical protein CRD36_02735 [Paremcibacter congregatus]QDE26580.1 DUF983 domain-containing protein [Paremcibacter congregatus]
MTENYQNKKVSPVRAGLFCKCPRCGEGALFQGFLTFRKSCPVCALDYETFDSGDGPALFIILLIGLIVIALALMVEVKFQPPVWVHMLLWVPCIMGGALGLMRPGKALMVTLQYHFNAQEGKLDQ